MAERQQELGRDTQYVVKAAERVPTPLAEQQVATPAFYGHYTARSWFYKYLGIYRNNVRRQDELLCVAMMRDQHGVPFWGNLAGSTAFFTLNATLSGVARWHLHYLGGEALRRLAM
jgi:hypothetical protein